jgi:DNA ligase 1
MRKIIKVFPTLYTKDREDRLREWIQQVVDMDNGTFAIQTKHGLQNGKQQVESVIISEGKNIGRANATTPQQQAILEAQSKWKGMKDKGYSENPKKIEQVLPMLAKKFKEYKHKITYPCYVQPKLDGVRCLSKRVNGVIEFISRKGKNYQTLSHIEKELKQIMEIGDIFDGEIYIHNVDFQDLISAIKNVKNKDKAKLNCEDLEYWIYDYADSTKDFEDRLQTLIYKNIGKKIPHIKLVHTYMVHNENDIMKYHKIFCNEGFEGIIIRNRLGKYEFNFRSDNLQKYKEFQDEEYEIIGVKSGIGRYLGCATFICKIDNGETFDCNPKCTVEKKQEYWNNKDDYIGKLLTVRFQEKSQNGIPRFPVGISIRDYE